VELMVLRSKTPQRRQQQEQEQQEQAQGRRPQSQRGRLQARLWSEAQPLRPQAAAQAAQSLPLERGESRKSTRWRP
jgi:hypothetical protein